VVERGRRVSHAVVAGARDGRRDARSRCRQPHDRRGLVELAALDALSDEGLERSGYGGMADGPHVQLVDPHTEGVGGDDDLDIVGH
jgi:hypothetical protein